MLRAIFTNSAPSPRGFYSQAVRVGELLFIAGQLPIGRDGRIVSGGICEETRQALSNLKAILESAGGKLSDLAQCTIYITDIELWVDVNQTYASFLSGIAVPPARTVVPVKQLHFGAMIEIQAIAYLAHTGCTMG